ncbi:MAG: hypothetical protein SGPRY_000941 [Prymnesium sp.]
MTRRFRVIGLGDATDLTIPPPEETPSESSSQLRSSALPSPSTPRPIKPLMTAAGGCTKLMLQGGMTLPAETAGALPSARSVAKFRRLASKRTHSELDTTPPSAPLPTEMAEGVEVACAALGVEGLERLKSLVTWQRSRIAQLAIQIRSSEQSMESHESEFDLSLQPELSDESLAWAESQLTLGLLEEGDGEGGQAQLLLRSVREASLQQLRLPSAPAGLVEAGGGVSPIDLAVQLLSELEELATLHQRSEWLKTRLQAHR